MSLCQRLYGSAFLCASVKLAFFRIVECRHLEVVWQFKLSIGIALEGFEVHQERVFDSEYSIVFNVLAAAVEDLCDNWLMARSCELFHVSICSFSHRNGNVTRPTRKWICAGLYGCLSSAFSTLPAGPSNGIG